jgi:cell wall assembly regulator SMI1
MNTADELRAAFADFQAALEEMHPELLQRLRPPVPFDAEYLGRPGTEQLRALWELTSGEVDDGLGVAGGTRVLGPADSEQERRKWLKQVTSGAGLDAIVQPKWDSSSSLDPDAVRAVYFAAGWIPVFGEPMEGNYLAVDLVPLSAGHPGQIVLCGRDEDEKCVVAPDLAHVFRALAAECRAGAWTVCTDDSSGKPFVYMEREGDRLLTACKEREFPPRA